MAQTKGVGFVNVQRFVRDRFGERAWDEVLSALSEADRQLLACVVSTGWYDLAAYARLIRQIESNLGTGQLDLLHALGRYEAEKDLTTLHRWLLKLFRPSIAIEQIGKYWRRFHDTGEWTTERNSDREIVTRLAGWGVVDSALCRELAGYFSRTLELLGGTEVKVTHPRCRAHGASTCEFHARWRLSRDLRPDELAAIRASVRRNRMRPLWPERPGEPPESSSRPPPPESSGKPPESGGHAPGISRAQPKSVPPPKMGGR